MAKDKNHPGFTSLKRTQGSSLSIFTVAVAPLCAEHLSPFQGRGGGAGGKGGFVEFASHNYNHSKQMTPELLIENFSKKLHS
jgi:hypothetical protein